MYFKDFLLEDLHVLNPRWATQGVYKIINSKLLAEGRGQLKLNSLNKILTNKRKGKLLYPKSKYRYIVSLMNKFELCHYLNKETILVPDLLSVSESDFGSINFSSEVIDFKLTYEFLPRSILPRFIVRLNKDIYNNLCWRTGVVLHDKNLQTNAVVKADYEEKQIHVSVYGELKKDYFPILIYFLREINNSFENLIVTEYIKIPDEYIKTPTTGVMLVINI